MALEQFVIGQKLRDGGEIVGMRIERGLLAYRIEHLLRMPQMPARQELVGRPVDAKEQIARRVVQRPGGRAAGFGRARVQGEVLAQPGQKGRAHTPSQPRKPASGRRNTQ